MRRTEYDPHKRPDVLQEFYRGLNPRFHQEDFGDEDEEEDFNPNR